MALCRAAFVALLLIAGVALPDTTRAAEPSGTDAATEDRIQAMIPGLDAYATRGIAQFHVPGLEAPILVKS